MNNKTIELIANDCSLIDNQEGHADAIQYFLSLKDNINVFQFTLNKKRLDDSPIAYFNYRDSKWYAGRYIGEASFKFNKLNYKIVIKPRFGDQQLFKMLEEVFNIRFTKSNSLIGKQHDFKFIVKKIIAFLWLNMLSKANKHGIPRTKNQKTYKGSKIHGRLNVKKSIMPLYTEEKLVSNFWEGSPNTTVVKILKSAYSILRNEYGISSVKSSPGSKNALEQLFSSPIKAGKVSGNKFYNIAYNNIYKSYKPVVDLSWDIIKRKNFGNNQQANEDGLSFFLDMAEIWELYLKSILKKWLSKDGWVLRDDIIQTYPKKDFRRKMIPDIVFQKGSDLLVWDAKYKRMEFDYFDFDRGDFFQIHTYIYYYEKEFNVVTGGLLYPLSKEYNDIRNQKNTSSSIFSKGRDSTSFIVDGIDLCDIDIISIKREEGAFLNRITDRLSQVKSNQ